MTETKISPTSLKLIGGWLPLDFVNTVDCRGSDRQHERLTSYSDLVSWGQHAGILTESEAQGLLQIAELRPTDAATVLKQAINLRETFHRIFSSIIEHRPPDPSDLDIMNAELCNAMDHLQIIPKADDLSWSYFFKGNTLDRVLWPIVRSAADLLTCGKLDRIRRCLGEDCGWLFLDMSRNRSRKWCDMKDCGNQAKARRHYEREHARKK